ncbi:hypothetical protein [Alloprevotella tannerae]
MLNPYFQTDPPRSFFVSHCTAHRLLPANHRLVGANYRLAAANHCLVAANEGYAARVRFSAALGGANYLLFDATSRRKS